MRFVVRDVADLLDARDRRLPVFLYDNADISAGSVPHLRTKWVKQLSRLDFVRGIKVSAPPRRLGHYTKAARQFRDLGAFDIYVGDALHILEMMRPRTGFWGAIREHWNRFLLHDLLPAGVVSGPANLLPREWQRAWQVASAGDVERMDELAPLFRAFSESYRFQAGKRSLAALKRGCCARACSSSDAVARGTAAFSADEGARFDAATREAARRHGGRAARRAGAPTPPARRSRERRGEDLGRRRHGQHGGGRDPHRRQRILGADEKSLLRADEHGETVRRLVGGVVLNHLGWARVLGLRTAIFGKQADDPNGRFLRAGMERLGIAHRIDLGGSASSFAQVYVDPSGARAIYMARGATAEYTPEEVESQHHAVISAASVVTTEVSQLPLATVRRVLELAREAGARTVVDLDVSLADAVPALGSEEELLAVLRLADVIKPSLSALDGLVPGGTARKRARALAERTGAKLVALTLGPAGCARARRGRRHRGARRAGPCGRHDRRGRRVPRRTPRGTCTPGSISSRPAKLGNACGGACCEQIGAFPDEPEAARARVLELYAALGGAPLVLRPLGRDATAAPSARSSTSWTSRRASSRPSRAHRSERARGGRRADPRGRERGGRVHVTGRRQARARRALRGVAALEHRHARLVPARDRGDTRKRRTDPARRRGDRDLEQRRARRSCCARSRRCAGFGARIVAVTGNAESALARAAEVVLAARVDDEGDALGLAPRASILAEIARCSARSRCELQEAKGFTREDYDRRHPAGELGKKSGR